MGVGGQRHAPAALLAGKTRCQLNRRLGRSHGRSGRAWKTSPTPGFDQRTVQPVASRYTDCAIPPLPLKIGVNGTKFLLPLMLSWFGQGKYISLINFILNFKFNLAY